MKEGKIEEGYTVEDIRRAKGMLVAKICNSNSFATAIQRVLQWKKGRKGRKGNGGSRCSGSVQLMHISVDSPTTLSNVSGSLHPHSLPFPIELAVLRSEGSWSEVIDKFLQEVDTSDGDEGEIACDTLLTRNPLSATLTLEWG